MLIPTLFIIDKINNYFKGICTLKCCFNNVSLKVRLACKKMMQTGFYLVNNI